MVSAKTLRAPSGVPVDRGTSCQRRKTSVKTSMNANTIISALMGSAGIQRAPSAVFVTKVTEHPPLGTIVKILTNAWRTIVFAREVTALILKGHTIVRVQMDSS